MQQWRLQAKTKHPRHVVPMLVSDAVRAAGGWIDDINLFGDFQLVVHFELPVSRRTVLEEMFADAGMRIYADEWAVSQPEGDVSGAITIAFLEP